MKFKLFNVLCGVVLISSLVSCNKSTVRNTETDENFATPRAFDAVSSSESSLNALKSAESISATSFVPDRVGFDFDKSSLNSDQIKILEEQLCLVRENESSIRKIIISGYADQRGSIEYNYSLGERRAEAVKRFFIGKGVARSKIETVSYGKEVILVQGDTEEAYRENRVARTVLCDNSGNC